LLDPLSTVLTSANLDTGSLTSNTKYYVYSTAATSSSTSSTYYISASSTAPSGQTYYYRIGNFTTDSSTRITALVNYQVSTSYVGSPTSKSIGVVYQATTDGIVVCYDASTPTNDYYVTMIAYTDSSSSPSTIFDATTILSNEHLGVSPGTYYGHVIEHVKKGDYYEVTIAAQGNSGSNSATMNFIPTSN